MTAPRSVSAYAALLRLHPRTFRDEYGVDMAQLLADQLVHERASRVWARGLLDLALSVPTQRLEAHMERPPTSTVPTVLTVIAVAGAALGIVAGSAFGIAGFAFGVALVAGVAAFAGWRRALPVAGPKPAGVLVAVGVAVLAAVWMITTATGELSEAAWLPAMLVALTGVILVATGVVRGIANRAAGRSVNAA